MGAEEHLGEQFHHIDTAISPTTGRAKAGQVYTRRAMIRTVMRFTDQQHRPSYIVHGLVTNVGERHSAAPLYGIGKAMLEHADKQGRWIHTSYMESYPKLGEFYKRVGGFKESPESEGSLGMGDIGLIRRPQTWKRTYTQGKLF
jgi:hypothetical protein